MFDTTPRTTPTETCRGVANDCECGCDTPEVGMTMRACDIEAGMVIQAISNYRASTGPYATVPPNVHEVDDVTYEFHTVELKRGPVEVITWNVVCGNTTLVLAESDAHTYVRIG
ncbi:hypothetical protein SEA_ADGERS_108 [Gordonia phage Adgers]|uniref:Uncharacterized protein n=1 Tax=Gordonia phage Adgers TaxID=2079413 RepID=A0A2L1IVI7_9CAUD|nr:hypothetical protein HWB50_gp026 [Gordonia phage Adgers]AVD99201.1 hypothetical protein SEA_ADGERS_108 [Gordonia phage Adgers]